MKRSTASRADLSLPILPLVVPLLALGCHSDDSGAGPADAAAVQDGTISSDATFDAGADAPSDVANGADAADAASATDARDGATGGCAAPTASPIVLAADITASTSWTCDHVYLVQGTIKVIAPATLTIAAGTYVLMSNDLNNDGNLIVGPGAQLVAVGTRDLPIVFTSSAIGVGAAPKPGDWGCVALVGRARGNWGTGSDGGALTGGSPDDASNFPGNSFPFEAGGDDPNNDSESSGTLQYVRIEYGGKVRNTFGAPADHEVLGLYGAGSGTLLDHVDMRQSVRGCLLAQGGMFRARHLVCQYGGNAGAMDFTRGNQSRAQFLLIQQNPNFSSDGVAFKGPHGSNQLPPRTSPLVYNVTACGTNGGIGSRDPYGFFMLRGPGGGIYNFIGSGFYAGLAMLDGPAGDAGPIPATTQMGSSILYGNQDPTVDASTNIFDPSLPPNDSDMVRWFETPGWLNSTDAGTPPRLGDCFEANSIRVKPMNSMTENAATPPNDGFFDSTATYIGAFKDVNDDWAGGKWVVWSDQ